MTNIACASDLRKQFLDFFVQRGHAALPSASLIPENDPTILFTTAGMHPLVPYLQGEPSPWDTPGQRSEVYPDAGYR